MDITEKLESLRFARESTPAVAAVPSAPLKKSESAVESIKEAKKHEFPVVPGSQKKKSPK
jgi:hypothetical protein